jgi:hypothetical protein
VGGNLLLGQEEYAYVDGTCEIELPAGQISLAGSKGPEYQPFREEVLLTPGQLSLRFEIKRWTNLRERGWYSGDVLARFLTPHGALLEGAAEDLAVVNLLALEYMDWHQFIEDYSGSDYRDPLLGEPRSRPRLYKQVSNILAFSGQRPALEARCDEKHRERLANIFRSAKEELLKKRQS